MAIPAYVEFYDDQGCKIEGDCRIPDKLTGYANTVPSPYSCAYAKIKRACYDS